MYDITNLRGMQNLTKEQLDEMKDSLLVNVGPTLKMVNLNTSHFFPETPYLA